MKDNLVMNSYYSFKSKYSIDQRFFKVFITVMSVLTFILFLNPQHAKAISPPQHPVISNSYFVNKVSYSSSGGFYQFSPAGYNEAAAENNYVNYCNSGAQYPVAIVLDFGQPMQGYSISTGYYGYGIRNWYEVSNNPSQVLSFNDVLSAAEAYAAGWYQKSFSCLRLTLIIGTSNSNECNGVSSCANTEGYQLRSTVTQLQTYLSNDGDAWQITAAGGDDIEAEWDSPSLTDQFVQGFNSNQGFGYLL